MTRDEWFGLCAFVNELFVQPIPQEKAAVYYEFAARDVPEPVMREALRRLVRSGAKFLPAAGELVEACNAVAGELPDGQIDAPSFSEVIGVVDGARFLGRSGAVDRVTEQCGELAAAWMCGEGIDALKAMDFGGEYGSVNRRDLERRYREFTRVQEDRARRGLPLAKATERGQLETGLRRVDPLRALEGGAAA